MDYNVFITDKETDMESYNIDLAIKRIKIMELYFDTVKEAFSIDRSLINDGPIGEMFSALLNYYEGGQWLADYEADEKGLIPCGLKRGILSQDAFFDFLSEIHEEN